MGRPKGRLVIPQPKTAAALHQPEPIEQEAAWVSEGDASAQGIYKDPDNPARFFRRGRGGKAKRTVKRVTVYLPEQLVNQLDMQVAKAGSGSVHRSAIVEEALQEHFQRRVTG